MNTCNNCRMSPWQDGELYAADGYRIHRVLFPIEGMACGIWELVKTKDGYTLISPGETRLKYPDIKALADTMARGCDKELTWSKAAGWSGIKDLDTQLALVAFDVFTQLGQPVDLRFLREAIKGMPGLTCFINGKDKPIILKDNDHFCMIMPVKLKAPEC